MEKNLDIEDQEFDLYFTKDFLEAYAKTKSDPLLRHQMIFERVLNIGLLKAGERKNNQATYIKNLVEVLINIVFVYPFSNANFKKNLKSANASVSIDQWNTMLNMMDVFWVQSLNQDLDLRAKYQDSLWAHYKDAPEKLWKLFIAKTDELSEEEKLSLPNPIKGFRSGKSFREFLEEWQQFNNKLISHTESFQTPTDSHTLEIFPLPLPATPFRGLCDASDCSSSEYPLKSFDPRWLYFGIKRPELQKWVGQVTVVLGKVEGKSVAMLDKIQGISPSELWPILSSVQKLLGYENIEFSLFNDVLNHPSNVSNNGAIVLELNKFVNELAQQGLQSKIFSLDSFTYNPSNPSNKLAYGPVKYSAAYLNGSLRNPRVLLLEKTSMDSRLKKVNFILEEEKFKTFRWPTNRSQTYFSGVKTFINELALGRSSDMNLYIQMMQTFVQLPEVRNLYFDPVVARLAIFKVLNDPNSLYQLKLRVMNLVLEDESLRSQIDSFVSLLGEGERSQIFHSWLDNFHRKKLFLSAISYLKECGINLKNLPLD